MPDQQEQQREQEQQQQQFQQWQQLQEQFGGGQQFGQQPRSQSQYDSLFGEQMFGDAATREVHQQYWTQAEETLRQARRVSEIYTMSLMHQHLVQKVSQAVIPQITQYLTPTLTQQITPVITQQVIQQLQQNPQLLKQAVQQASR